jgi:exopolyphosphatase/guanosine-5'-triphosphate,3'-diphosphate pyrophosphatase
MPLVAAIDVGANSVNLLVADVSAGRLVPRAASSALVGLAEGLDGTGMLAPDRIDAAAELVAALAEESRQLGVERIAVVSTEPARAAGNAAELLERLHQAAGVAPRVLSGEEEAALTFRGIVAMTPYAPPDAAAIDLGGGSLEVMGGARGRIAWMVSLPIGTRRFTERWRIGSPPDRNLYEPLVEAVETDVLPAADRHPVDFVMATGGSAWAISTIADTDVLDRVALDATADYLSTTAADEVARASGVDEARVMLLFAATAILEGARRAMEVDDLLVTAAGLKEGVALEEGERM